MTPLLRFQLIVIALALSTMALIPFPLILLWKSACWLMDGKSCVLDSAFILVGVVAEIAAVVLSLWTLDHDEFKR